MPPKLTYDPVVRDLNIVETDPADQVEALTTLADRSAARSASGAAPRTCPPGAAPRRLAA